MKVLVLVLALITGTALACSIDGKSGFLPENDMRIPVGTKNILGGISEKEFNAVITKIETIYAPVVRNMGAQLSVERLWTNEKVNADASQPSPRLWKVRMYGGLARHSAITKDGFALVMCHELGHHLGGAPKVKSFFKPWASSEGQSDYFATLKCLRQVFLNDNNAEIVKTLGAPAYLVAQCKKAFRRDDVAICIRSGMAGVSVAALFASGGGKLASLNTPDTTQVSSNFDEHPATQCRLDTFFQGAICTASPNEDVDQRDEVRGTCHGSLGHTSGLRPRCWHKPVSR